MQIRKLGSRRARIVAGATVAAAAMIAVVATAASGTGDQVQHWSSAPAYTTTPIKHVVVIFDENISFDHYFGTYPNATNQNGTPFQAKPHTPNVNGLTKNLLQHNPNQYNPKRLAPSQALTCDQDHDYGAEQKAFDGGKMDKFVEFTEKDTCTGQPILFGEPGLVMDYYDGNTVTAMWNYAQNFALNDNSYNSNFGPSAPGALNLVSGNTHGVQAVTPVDHQPTTDSYVVASPDKNGIGSVITDPDPAFDDCSDKNHTATDNLAAMHGTNIGDVLNKRGLTWGWFQGGFRPTGQSNGFSVCGATHANIGGQSEPDYVPHHEPFQYYPSTANEHHLPPSSAAAIGHTDQANHQYDITDFDTALQNNNLPAVSFLKPPQYQNGHASNSDPLDEQHFLVHELNQLQQSKEWSSTAVVLAYDDSDGWYDHQQSQIVNGSQNPAQDQPMCSKKKATLGSQARCGYGPRLPLLVMSPYAKKNFVDHTHTDQTSVLKFIQQNWLLPPVGNGSYDLIAGSLSNMFNFRQRPDTAPLLLNEQTGAVSTK